MSRSIDSGLKSLEQATSINPSLDLYFRQLAQVYLVNMQVELKNEKDSQDERSRKAQILIANALNASKISTDISPKNVSNWSVRASVYQNLIGLFSDADTWAITSYSKALELDPINPYLFLQRGIVYYQKKDYKNAKTDLEQATTLKSDYPDALYFLGLTYGELNQKDKAIDAFSKILKIISSDQKDQIQNIQKILDNLKVGKPTLEGLGGQQSPSPTQPPEILTAPQKEAGDSKVETKIKK